MKLKHLFTVITRFVSLYDNKYKNTGSVTIAGVGQFTDRTVCKLNKCLFKLQHVQTLSVMFS